MKPLYILTAADGFTCAVEAEPVLVGREVVRLNLKLPLEVVHWSMDPQVAAFGVPKGTVWKRHTTFSWPIEGRTWP